MNECIRIRRGNAIATATVAALVSLVSIPGCTASPARPDASPSAATGSPATEPPPSPTPSYPLSTAPRTIPAVREHEAARGPGWKPAPDARVVVPPANKAALADEGKLLAGE
ncbi:beta-N-acetylglucosaminidase, partial [Streptomyces goshikiensis]